MQVTDLEYNCIECGDEISERRVSLGYNVCLSCGDILARKLRKNWTIVPVGPKQGYTRVSSQKDLVGIYRRRSW